MRGSQDTLGGRALLFSVPLQARHAEQRLGWPSMGTPSSQPGPRSGQVFLLGLSWQSQGAQVGRRFPCPVGHLPGAPHLSPCPW